MILRLLFSAALTVTLFLISSPAHPAAAGQRPWKSVYSWGYQLQNPKVEQIAASPYDLVVIDYSRDGCDDCAFTKRDLKIMKRKPDGGRRLVVAYMSIGEAEPYRFYWKKGWSPGKPSWLCEANPDWPDNFKVRFWDRKWQKLIFGSKDSYLDRIMAAGFDGVYLDIVDGYEYFARKRPAAAKEMIGFVCAIADYARRVKGDSDFGVFPQNALDLLEDPRYLKVITGVGKEETYFRPNDEATPEESRKWDQGLLDRAFQAGKLVLLVDYCKNRSNVATVYETARRRGYIPYCSNVALDRLTIIDEVALLTGLNRR